MKQAFLIFSLFIIAHILHAQPDVRISELARFDAMTKRDSAQLIALLDKKLSYTHSNGLHENKKEFIRSVLSGRIVYQSIRPDTAIVTQKAKTANINGEITVSGLFEGKPFTVRLQYISTYRLRKKTWRLDRWISRKIN